MGAMTDRIIKRVRGKGRGWSFTPKDFLDLGTRGSVDVALSRLVQAGDIRRLGRGLYDYPRMHPKLGALTPDTDSLVQAVANQTGDKVFASGAQVANAFGLSTQVPAKATYATTGASRVMKIAGRTITLKRTRAPILGGVSPKANALLQLFAHVGKARIDDDLIRRCAARLDDGDLKDLKKAQAHMPGWMSDAVLKIALLKRV
jgi:hypothetical protein